MRTYADLFAPLIGRILMGGFFIWSGIQAALNFPSAVDSIAAAGAPWPITLTIVAIFTEVICGSGIVVGFKTTWSAMILVIYVIIVAFFYTGLASSTDQALFLQDMAIVGGLLYISAYGAGSWASDWHYKR